MRAQGFSPFRRLRLGRSGSTDLAEVLAPPVFGRIRSSSRPVRNARNLGLVHRLAYNGDVAAG
jgi:hypothetical protein